jgi:hypothetical protein
MQDIHNAVISAIYELQRASRAPTFSAIRHRTGIAPDPLCAILEQLAAENLLDLERIRLTLLGFATAHALATGQRADATRAA